MGFIFYDKKRKFYGIVILLTLICFLMPISSYADNNDYWANGYAYDDSSQLSIQLFSSAYQDFSSTVGNNFAAWNGYDSNLYIESYVYHSNDTQENKPIRVIGGSIPGYYGMTQAYKKILLFWVTASGDETWGYNQITLGTNSGGLSSQDSNMKKRVFIHEVGHTIKLTHPDPVETSAIMRSDVANSTLLSPQAHDTDNLKAKW